MHPAAAPGRGHPRVPASAGPQEAREAVLPNEGEARCPLTPSVHPKPVPPLLAAWRGWGEAQRSSPSLLPTAPFQPQPSGPAAAMLRWQRVGRSHPTCGPQGQGQCPPPRRGLPRGTLVNTRQEQQHGNSLQAHQVQRVSRRNRSPCQGRPCKPRGFARSRTSAGFSRTDFILLVMQRGDRDVM